MVRALWGVVTKDLGDPACNGVFEVLFCSNVRPKPIGFCQVNGTSVRKVWRKPSRLAWAVRNHAVRRLLYFGNVLSLARSCPQRNCAAPGCADLAPCGTHSRATLANAQGARNAAESMQRAGGRSSQASSVNPGFLNIAHPCRPGTANSAGQLKCATDSAIAPHPLSQLWETSDAF